MKGDFTRNSFKPANHYQAVLMQQGRVQLDADSNEQASIALRRDETTMADVAGHCGGPANGAGFDLVAVPAPKIPGDFLLTSGRYYVDGIQCENESSVSFFSQPDRFEVGELAKDTAYLIYLDVWQRHITPLEAPALREAALGGPDTATRVKTVWQVRAAQLSNAENVGCTEEVANYLSATKPSTIRMKAAAERVKQQTDPCQLPETAGYKGLENQLYRVEVHELKNDGSAKTLKWSRENGSVVAALRSIKGDELNVDGLRDDAALGISEGQFVEIIDDNLELEGKPGQWIEVASADAASGVIKLKSAAVALAVGPGAKDGVNPTRHPKIRRWEGVANATPGQWIAIEAGIKIQLDYNGAPLAHTGDYWQIPARTANPEATEGGDIEWERELKPDGTPDPDKPVALSPFGIKHHYCRLGFVEVDNAGNAKTTDCRCLWPSLTSVPRIFYVSGDGQEVMPKPGVPLIQLPHPLIVGIGHGHCLEQKALVRFTATSGGQVAEHAAAPVGASVNVPIGPDGTARCDFWLDATIWSQQVTARLLDSAGVPVSLPVIFNANLSIASEVAYDPKGCVALKDSHTVQDAIARLSSLAHITAIGGDGQDVEPGKTLANLVRVSVTRKCGPVKGAIVSFETNGNGTVTDPKTGAQAAAQDVETGSDGIAACEWTPAASPPTQELLATLITVPDNEPIETPAFVAFTANVRSAGHGGCCCVAIGRGGEFETIKDAIDELWGARKFTDLCLCLMAGDHIIERHELFEKALDANVHLRISGCGLGTRLKLASRITFSKLGSVALLDLSIIASKFGLFFISCKEVEVSRCHISGNGMIEVPLVLVSGAVRATLEQNVMTARLPGKLVPILEVLKPVGKLGTITADSSAVFAANSSNLVRDFVAPGFRDKRIALARQLSASIETFALKLTPTQIVATKGLLDSISVTGDASSAMVLGKLEAIRELADMGAMGFALILSDFKGAATIADNQVDGIVSLGPGVPMAEHISSALKLKAMAAIKEGKLKLLPTEGSLRMNSNQLGWLTVGQDAWADINQAVTLELWRSGMLTDNEFAFSPVYFAAFHVSLMSNQFLGGNDYIGASISDSLSAVGNRCRSSGTWEGWSATPPQAAANIRLSV